MPGSDDQYDQVHTYSQDHAGKSKTTKPAVREIGRDGAPVQLFVGKERDETQVRTPPAGVVYTFINTSGNPRVIDSTGTVGSPVDGQAISPSSVDTDELYTGGRTADILTYPSDFNDFGGDYLAVDAQGTVAGPNPAESVLQTVLDNIPSTGSTVFIIGTGYRPTSTLTATAEGTSIVGSGRGENATARSRLFLENNTDDDLLELGDPATVKQGFRLADVHLDGNKANNTAGSCLSIVAGNVVVERVWVNNAPDDGILVSTTAGTVHEGRLSNLLVDGPGRDCVQIAENDHHLVNAVLANAGRHGFRATGSGLTAEALHIYGATDSALSIEGSDGYFQARIFSTDARGVEVTAGNGENVILVEVGSASAGASTVPAIDVAGDNNWIGGHVAGGGGESYGYEVTGTENVAWLSFSGSFSTGRVNLGGTRNIVNGYAENAGDPRSTGDWNGNAGFAYDHGAVVFDTSVTPDQPYIPMPDGNWKKIPRLQTTASVSPGFDTWTQADADNPTLIIAEVQVDAASGTDAQVDLEVDESGGTTADYNFTAFADSALGAHIAVEQLWAYLPAGAQYRFNNVSDPNTNNGITGGPRQLTL